MIIVANVNTMIRQKHISNHTFTRSTRVPPSVAAARIKHGRARTSTAHTPKTQQNHRSWHRVNTPASQTCGKHGQNTSHTAIIRRPVFESAAPTRPTHGADPWQNVLRDVYLVCFSHICRREKNTENDTATAPFQRHTLTLKPGWSGDVARICVTRPWLF